jgi:hypothetical protein
MPNDAPTTASSATAPKAPADLAIGASLTETVGDQGEIVARRNTSFNLDAMGLPRSRFTIVSPNTPAATAEEPAETGPKAEEVKPPAVGQDLLSVLGDKAVAYSRVGGGFALDMANILFGTILVGAIMSLTTGTYNALTDDGRPRTGGAPEPSAGNNGTTAPATAATGPAGTAQNRDDYARTRVQEPLATIPVADGDEPATAVPAARTASTTRVAAAASSAEPASGGGRVIDVPVDRATPASMVCEVPKPEAETKKCVLPARPPRM